MTETHKKKRTGQKINKAKRVRSHKTAAKQKDKLCKGQVSKRGICV